jgi:HEAT repeat protein
LEEAAAQPQPPQAHAPSDELDRLADAMFERELALPIRLWVIEQVAADPDPRAVPMLARLLEDPDIEVVRAAVSALASRPEPAAQQALLPLRAHHDAEITRRIGQLLGAPR